MEQQNTKKLSDKAFAHLALTSILGILVCIICLSATTYAWFTGSVQGNDNKIQAANECLISVSVCREGEADAVATVGIKEAVTLDCEGTYTVTLTLPSGSASGYLILTVGDDKYYTDFLQRNETEKQTLTFTLDVQTEKTVTFTARWGIYSGECNVGDGGTLVLS